MIGPRQRNKARPERSAPCLSRKGAVFLRPGDQPAPLRRQMRTAPRPAPNSSRTQGPGGAGASLVGASRVQFPSAPSGVVVAAGRDIPHMNRCPADRRAAHGQDDPSEIRAHRKVRSCAKSGRTRLRSHGERLAGLKPVRIDLFRCRIILPPQLGEGAAIGPGRWKVAGSGPAGGTNSGMLERRQAGKATGFGLVTHRFESCRSSQRMFS